MEDSVVRKIIDQLRQEQRYLAEAIQALERLASGKPRRGRPPKKPLPPPSEQRPAKPRKRRSKIEKPELG